MCKCNHWQKIETAPKDGTHVLLRYYKGGSSYRTRASKVFVVTEGYWAGPGESYYPTEWWMDALGRMIQDTKAKKSKSIVVSWMPLPEVEE